MAEEPTQTLTVKRDIPGTIGVISVLSIILAPMLLIGPFIAGYIGGRRTKCVSAAITAAIGPAIIWCATWWWFATHEVALGPQKITPTPLTVLAPTTALAILGGACAGSNMRKSRILGCAMLIAAGAWIWPSAREIIALGTLLRPEPTQATVPEDKTCVDRLKKLYAAAMLYSDSWDGLLPPRQTWVSALRDPSQPFGEEEIFHCPDVPEGTAGRYGYAMNSSLGGMRISDIKNREQTPLFFDTNDLNIDASMHPNSIVATSRHSGNCNVIYLDGTVRPR